MSDEIEELRRRVIHLESELLKSQRAISKLAVSVTRAMTLSLQYQVDALSKNPEKKAPELQEGLNNLLREVVDLAGNPNDE